MGVFIRCEKCGKDLFYTSKEENANLKNYPRLTILIYTVKPCGCSNEENTKRALRKQTRQKQKQEIMA